MAALREQLARSKRGFVRRLSSPSPLARTLILVALGFGLPLQAALPALAEVAGQEDALPVLKGTSAGASAVNAATPVSPINYARPKKRKPLLPKALGRPNARPLPALQAYPTAPVYRRRGTLDPQAAPGPTVAAIPVLPAPKRHAEEANPFDPIGFDVGSLRLKPYIELDTGYDSNPNQQATSVRGSLFGRTEGGVTAQSNWSVHELDASLKAGYSDYFKARDASRPDASAIVNGRLDATRDLAFDAQGRFALGSQRAGSAGVLQNVTLGQRPLTYAYGGSLGATQKINRLTLLLRGSVDRSNNDNATDVAGNIINLALQDYNSYALRGRASYEVTPGISPFVDATVDKRVYDARLDGSGFDRNSNGFAAKAGSSFELSRILTGELSAGYARRDYADTRLKPLSGPTIDAALVWTASPLTTVTLAGTTALNETTVTNSSGALTRGVTLTVAHALFRNFTLTGVASYQLADYQGSSQRETTWGTSLKADYNLTRSVMVRSSFTHQRLQSTVPGSDYTANTVMLGLRFQP